MPLPFENFPLHASPSSVLASYRVLLDGLQGIFGKQKKYIKGNFSIWNDCVIYFTLFVPGLYLYTCIDLQVLNHPVLLEGIQFDYSIQSFNVLNSACKYFYWFVWGVCVCLCTYVYLYTRQFVISWDQTEAIKLDHECLVLSFQPLGSLVLEWGFLYLCSSRKLDSFYVRVMLALKSEFWQNPFETYLFDRALKELCLIVLHLEFIT